MAEKHRVHQRTPVELPMGRRTRCEHIAGHWVGSSLRSGAPRIRLVHPTNHHVNRPDSRSQSYCANNNVVFLGRSIWNCAIPLVMVRTRDDSPARNCGIP